MEEPSDEPVIEVRALRKTYGDGTEAVRDIDFTVSRGEFFGFLGPNGAGKSTTIKILITLLEPSAGAVRVLGRDVRAQAAAVRRGIGYAAQEAGVDDDLSARENLRLQGRLYHLPRPLLEERIAELLDLMDLAVDADRPAGSFSGGMRKRLDLATGLIHRPEVLFLDEPTTGLDPQNRASLWQYLERLNAEEGLTIFLTTHYMEEADRLCDRLAIIDHGRIVTSGTPAGLKADLGGDTISLAFKESVPAERARALVGRLPFVRSVDEEGGALTVIVQNGAEAVPALLRALDADRLPVARLALTTPTLDDVFLRHTGSRIRGEELDERWRSRMAFFGAGRRRR